MATDRSLIFQISFMKRLYILLCLLTVQILLFAQRGRLRPEDYMDYEDVHHSSSSDGSPIIYIILLVAMVIGIIWFKISLNSSRKQEISTKTKFLTKPDKIFGFKDGYSASQNSNRYYKNDKFFTEQNEVVAIPRLSQCIILEYWPENHSFVKVKFDNYPTPLYIGRWHLRTPDRIND